MSFLRLFGFLSFSFSFSLFLSFSLSLFLSFSLSLFLFLYFFLFIFLSLYFFSDLSSPQQPQVLPENQTKRGLALRRRLKRMNRRKMTQILLLCRSLQEKEMLRMSKQFWSCILLIFIVEMWLVFVGGGVVVLLFVWLCILVWFVVVDWF